MRFHFTHTLKPKKHIPYLPPTKGYKKLSTFKTKKEQKSSSFKPIEPS